jgi:hypothetical protein
MSHVSLSEISTRRFPLNDKGLEQTKKLEITGYNSWAKTTRVSLSIRSFLQKQAIQEQVMKSNIPYSRAHDLCGKFLPYVVVHEWYLEHVKIPVHIVLPVCFEEFWKHSVENIYEKFSEAIPGTANANSSKSKVIR